MSERNVMLKIDNVSKMYKLGQIGGTTLRDELQRVSAKIRGKEDPTRMIGAKDYNKGETFLALDGVSFDVRQGERIGIIGHNGAGKSTLLKLISRVTAPTGGKIGLNGRVASMLEVGTGFHGELTGRENIYMNGAILGMTKREIDNKIEDIIDFSEVRQFIDTPVKRYSSGMYVKLAFSVAAHLDSEILIMDEVLAVGDMAFQKKCLEKMSAVSKNEGRTVLYVSHNMNTIRQLCERCIVLDHGKVVFDGGVDEGIQIYLNNTEKSNAALIDLSKVEREGFLEEPDLFSSIKVLSPSSWKITNEDAIQFELCLNAYKGKLKDIFLRVIIKYSDATPIGMGMTDVSVPINMETESKSAWELDISYLPSGQYLLTLALFGLDDVGNQTFIDVVNNIVEIDISREVDKQKIAVWKHHIYGHVHIKTIRPISVTTNS